MKDFGMEWKNCQYDGKILFHSISCPASRTAQLREALNIKENTQIKNW